jgi:hypothetical protein
VPTPEMAHLTGCRRHRLEPPAGHPNTKSAAQKDFTKNFPAIFSFQGKEFVSDIKFVFINLYTKCNQANQLIFVRETSKPDV